MKTKSMFLFTILTPALLLCALPPAARAECPPTGQIVRVQMSAEHHAAF